MFLGESVIIIPQPSEKQMATDKCLKAAIARIGQYHMVFANMPAVSQFI
jgi:hypothetical protein